ncbi:MAG: amidohydrolase family protein [Clostridia bacterium]
MKEARRIVDKLIVNGIIVPMSGDILLHGAIAIDNGKIVGIGEQIDILSVFSARETLDAKNMAVLPGFINTHFHATQNFLKGSRDDCELLSWIDNVSFPRIKVVVDQYKAGIGELHKHATIHAGIDLLKSGITTSVNMEWAMLPEIVDTYELLGMRFINVLTLTDVNTWTPPEAILSHDEYFSLADDLNARCKSSKLNEFAYGIACPNSNTAELILKTRTAAYKKSIKIHIHLAETLYEMKSVRSKHLMTPTAYMELLGLWDKDVWAAHSIWLTDEDINILKKYQVGIAHNPKCNMKIADGVAPIRKMLAKGLHVGLGIDSCAVSDNTDFFEAMRTAVFLQRIDGMDATAILGEDALVMATIGGAAALGREKELGSLEVGKEADIIFVDLRACNIRPFNNIVNNLVFAANSSNIKAVLVAGDVLLWDGKLVKIDEAAALDAAEEYASYIFRKAGLQIPEYFSMKEFYEKR